MPRARSCPHRLALLRARKRRERHADAPRLPRFADGPADRPFAWSVTFWCTRRARTSSCSRTWRSSSSCTSPKPGRKQHFADTRGAVSDLKHAAVEEKRGTGSVASPRLDSVAVSRFLACRARTHRLRIEKGLVFVNNAPCMKPEHQIHGRRPPDRARRGPCAQMESVRRHQPEGTGSSSDMSEMRKYWQTCVRQSLLPSGFVVCYTYRQHRTMKAAALCGNFVP